LIDPITSTPFPGKIIPASRLFGTNGLYAFRVGPQEAAAVPEPATFGFIVIGGLAANLLRLKRHGIRDRFIALS
jgi:hypothetical protein